MFICFISAWGIKKFHESTGTMHWDDRKRLSTDEHHDDDFPDLSMSCVLVSLATVTPRCIQTADLLYPHSYSCSEPHISNVEKHLTLNKGYPLDRKELSHCSSLSTVFINWRQHTFGSWINSAFPSFHGARDRMFVCSHDGSFPCSILATWQYLFCLFCTNKKVNFHWTNSMINVNNIRVI